MSGSWRAIFLATGVGAAVAAATAGGPGAVLVLAAGTIVTATSAHFMAKTTEERRFVVPVVVAATLCRSLFASVLHLVLLPQGHGGAMFPDDEGYGFLGTMLARRWHGEDVAFDDSDPSTMNEYVAAVGGLFWILGPNVVALKLTNTTLGVLAALFAYRSAAAIAGSRAARVALVLMLIFPSLVLWASLGLKDTFVLTAMLGAVWILTKLSADARPMWTVAAALFLLPLRTTREYIYLILGVAWLLAMVFWLISQRDLRNIRRYFAIAVGVLVIFATPGRLVQGDLLQSTESTRNNMGESVRSTFVQREEIVTGDSGTRFVVTVTNVTPDPQRTPAVIQVTPGTAIVYAGQQSNGNGPKDAIPVMPGDIVIIVPAASKPPSPRSPPRPSLPTTAPSPGPVSTLELTPVGTAIIADTASSTEIRAERTAFAILRGLLYVAGAPFPWAMRTASEFAFGVELVFWYPTLVLGLIGLYFVVRRRRWDAAYLVVTSVGVAATLSLIEGNVGTLVRHRSMLIPYEVILAAFAFKHLPHGMRDRGGLRPEI